MGISLRYWSKPISQENFMLYKKFADDIKDLLGNERVKSMATFTQHSDVSCLKHCLHVAIMSYIICKKLKFNESSCRNVARGALLHDMFLYDWHDKNHGELHGFRHPAIALKKAEKYVDNLTECQKDIILNHMWPLTIYRMPQRKETYVVVLTDKICTVLEVFKMKKIKIFKQAEKLL